MSRILAAPRALRALSLVFALVAVLTPVRAAHADGVTHVVQPGENLFRIGLRYSVGWLDIMAANGLHSTYIYPGQVLVIPGSAGSPRNASIPSAASDPASPASAPALGPAVVGPTTVGPTTAGSVYTVQRGDALYLIAIRYHVSVAELMQANGLANPSLIYAGQVLAVPAAGQPATAPAAAGHWLSVTGHPQALPLDCEARAAADLAGYWGVYINELEFFNRLPVSDDPDTGFVGDVRGAWGQTPPNAYGVNAEPVAALLRAYGVNARAASDLDVETLRAEIDLNRPVMVWVVGHVAYGAGFAYTAASNGHTGFVAPFEHTVLVTGYGHDTVTVLDGAAVYTRSLAQFLASWGVLGNQAVLAALPAP